MATASSPASALRRKHLPSPLPSLARQGGLAFGDGRVDACLPPGGLPLGCAHEIAGEGIEAETGTLAAAFAAVWLARLPPRAAGGRPIVWIAPSGDLHPPGLLAYGLDPARLLLVDSADDAQTLAAMEAALRSGAAAAVVAEVGRAPRLAGRRLHLACLARGATGFVLRRWPFGAKGETAGLAGVATRWRLAPAPSAAEDARDVGPPRWRMELAQARGGRPGAWVVEHGPQAWGEDGDAGALRVVAGLADAAPEAGRRRA